jgi:hypothetical protein
LIYLYRDLRFAKETIPDAKLPSKPGEGCDKCDVSCTVGFDVRAKVEDINRLNYVAWEFLV